MKIWTLAIYDTTDLLGGAQIFLYANLETLVEDLMTDTYEGIELTHAEIEELKEQGVVQADALNILLEEKEVQ